MSNPIRTYRIVFKAFHESTDLQCYIDISDMDNLISGDTEIIELEGAGTPCRPTVIDNNEDPFTVIRAQQLTIQFNSDANTNASTFMSGSDNRWLVHYYLGDNTNTIFKGYLVIDDIGEDFLPYPNIVTLTANDGLGLLKDIKLVNADGDNPSGYHRISDYLTWALRQTGLELDMRAAFNIKRSDLISDISIPNTVAQHFFYTTYLEAKTFEDEIGTSIDCYTSIEQILGEEACLFQMWGKWWILRIDEVEETRGLYISSFDSSGSFIENLGEIDFVKEIGITEDIFFSQGATSVTGSRPNKYVRLNYDYETPREVPCNSEFLRGDYDSDLTYSSSSVFDSAAKTITLVNTVFPPLAKGDYITVSGTSNNNGSYNVADYYTSLGLQVIRVEESSLTNETVTATINYGKKYGIDCWTLREGYPGGYGTVDGTTATVHRKFNYYGGETEKYTVLTPRTTQESGSWNDVTHLESEAIPVDKNDKVSATIDFRLNLGIASGGGSYDLMRMMLYGDDGSYWVLGRPSDTSGTDDTVTWYDTALFTQNSGRGITVIDFDTFNEEEWHNLSWDSPPCPVAGNIHIWLNQFNQSIVSGDDKEIWYNNFTFEYRPFIKGSYQTYTGQYHKVSQTPAAGDYKAKREKRVYIGDSPKKLFKGALFEFDGSNYILVDDFYNAAVFPGGPPSSDYIHPYGEIQVFDVWNQFNREMRVVQGTMQGLDLDKTKLTFPYPAHLINKYRLTDTSLHSTNKQFILLSYDQEHHSGGWTGVLREVFDTTRSKQYLGHEFKYST